MMVRAHLPGAGDSVYQRRMGELLARHLAHADLSGRIQILRHAQRVTKKLFPLSTRSRTVLFADGRKAEEAANSLPALTIGTNFGFPDATSSAYIRSLTPVTRAMFDGLTDIYRRNAFTLAGTSDVRLIEKIRNELAQVAEKGGTKRDFQKAVAALHDEADIKSLNAFSLDTAFNTAMQKAYSAGRLEQMQEDHIVDALPYWQYWTMEDDRVRPEHAVLDQFLARAIDPVWHKIYPPSGFNCRCAVVPVTAEEALEQNPHASEGGMERLPALAVELVPQPGFHSLMAR
jgi:SPP1 gp7 family putative phage head morphogenesis protein